MNVIFTFIIISSVEVSKATKLFRYYKYVGADGIPSSVIKGCSHIFYSISDMFLTLE
jgi:hypothetical protein